MTEERTSPAGTPAGFAPEQVDALRAARDVSRTPEVVRAALLPHEFVIRGTQPVTGIRLSYLLEPVRLPTVMLLEELGNPLLEGGKAIGARHAAEVIFILSRPVKDALHLLRQGKNVFDEAVLLFAEQFDLDDYLKACAAIGGLVRQAYSTAMAARPAEDKKKAGDKQ